jgi:hypothetical protein
MADGYGGQHNRSDNCFSILEMFFRKAEKSSSLKIKKIKQENE